MENKKKSKRIQFNLTMEGKNQTKTFDLKISSKENNQIVVDRLSGGPKRSEVYDSIDADNPTFNITLKLGDQLNFVKVFKTRKISFLFIL